MSNLVKVNCDLQWAYLDKPHVDGMFPDGKYKVNCAGLSEKATEALTSLGLSVKNKEAQGNFVTCKSSQPIRVYAPDGSQIDGSSVGNGSKGIATISFYENGYGKFPQLNKLIITELKEFNANGISVDEDSDLDVL